MISSSQFSSGSPEGEQFTFVTHHPDMRLVRGALRARARSIAIANEVTRLIRIEQQGSSENDSSAFIEEILVSPQPDSLSW